MSSGVIHRTKMVKEEDCHPPVSYSKELRNRFVLSDKSRIVHRPSSISPVTARLYRSCRTRQALRDQDTLYEDELVQLGLDDDDQMYSRPRRTHRSARHVSRSRRNTRPHSIMRSMRPQRHSTQILEVSDRARRSLRSGRHSLPNGLPQQRSGMANGHMSTRGSRRREGEEEEEEAEDGEDDEGEEGEDEEEEAEEVADEEDSHEAEGVRRSTRRRKLLYDNFNTSWILGTQKLRGYPMFEDRQEPREERKVEGEECQSDHVKEDEESAKKASIMEQNSDDRLEKLSGLRSKSASNRANT
ncbi:hypothetical protein J437_LFUL014691, partial [Ladona fulva]